MKKDKEEIYVDPKIYNSTSIGSDEVGTGDYFGPIVVCSAYVKKEDIPFLEELGVKDSKKLDDNKIMEIVPLIIKKIPYSSIILTNKEYNQKYNDDDNSEEENEELIEEDEEKGDKIEEIGKVDSQEIKEDNKDILGIELETQD